MKNASIIFLLVILGSLSCFAQGENDNWFFGDHAGINLASNPPTAISGMLNESRNGVASVSDSNGQLLFYTDGHFLYNRNHVAMPETLTGYYMCEQTAIIVPFPEHPGQYYVFSNANFFNSGANNNPTAYSVIDMNINAGLGSVTTLNIPLLDENGQPIYINSDALTSAINHQGNGYWILIQRNNQLYSYELTKTGLNNVPTVTNLTFPSGFHNMMGFMKVSPDKSKIAIIQNYQPGRIRVYGFNDTNGTIDTNSFSYAIDDFWLPFAAEFSPNSQVLYVSTWGNGTNAYNLSNPVSVQSRMIDPDSYSAIQLTRWGEIYMTKGLYDNMNVPYLSRITTPDNYATSTVDNNFITLTGNCGMGLPQMVRLLPCQDNLTLNIPEISMTFSYQVSNTMTTESGYSVNPGQNITMNAGNAIAFKPDTHLKSGATVLARIQACPETASRQSENPVAVAEPKATPISRLQVYPNPAQDFVNLTVTATIIQSVEVSSIIDQKRICKVGTINSADYQLNTSSFAKGIYIMAVRTIDGKTFVEKIIKN